MRKTRLVIDRFNENNIYQRKDGKWNCLQCRREARLERKVEVKDGS